MATAIESEMDATSKDSLEQNMDLASAKQIILRSAKDDPAVIDAMYLILNNADFKFLRLLNRDFFNKLL